jgi:hypothetical protein
MRTRVILILILLLGLASPAATQIGVPPLGQTLGSALDGLDRTVGGVAGLDLEAPVRSVTRLAQERVARLTGFVRANRDRVEVDDMGQPARRGVVLLLDADPASVEAAQRLGFAAGGIQRLDTLGLSTAELTVPAGVPLPRALQLLRKALPGKTLTADQLHFPSGSRGKAAPKQGAARMPPIGTPVGMIDGGVAGAVPVARARGFAAGGPVPSNHGTAVASLMRHAGVSHIVAADVYGRDPAGGNALAIARALDWMAAEKVRVISISLVGPRNPLLERAIAALSARGTTIVAAVGNDGPAAPPAYPASYAAVVAVTGVDGRDRALIEAGRALHLDYAAPGADMRVADAAGRSRAVRGTSFAAPLVAARVAVQVEQGRSGRAVLGGLDAEARDLGRKGPDSSFGRGLLCGQCRPR